MEELVERIKISNESIQNNYSSAKIQLSSYSEYVQLIENLNKLISSDLFFNGNQVLGKLAFENIDKYLSQIQKSSEN